MTNANTARTQANSTSPVVPRKILTFSHGAHHCLGAAAARMQARVTLTELLSRCPDFEVDEDAIVWAGGSYVRRPLSVPFRVIC